MLSRTSCPIRINHASGRVCVYAHNMTRSQKNNSLPLWRLVCFSVWWPPNSFVSPASNGGCIHAPCVCPKKETHTCIFINTHILNEKWYMTQNSSVNFFSLMKKDQKLTKLPLVLSFREQIPSASMLLCILSENQLTELSHLLYRPSNSLFIHSWSQRIEPNNLCFLNKAWLITRSPPGLKRRKSRPSTL